MHFLQEFYKFVQESQILQVCYNVEHFGQDSDNIFGKSCIFVFTKSALGIFIDGISKKIRQEIR